MMNHINKDNLIEFLIMALKRSLWTFAEVIVVMVPMGMSVSEVDWKHVLGVAIGAFIVSFCKSVIAGMPEFGSDGELMLTDKTCQVNLGIDEATIKSKGSVRLTVIPDESQK